MLDVVELRGCVLDVSELGGCVLDVSEREGREWRLPERTTTLLVVLHPPETNSNLFLNKESRFLSLSVCGFIDLLTKFFDGFLTRFFD